MGEEVEVYGENVTPEIRGERPQYAGCHPPVKLDLRISRDAHTRLLPDKRIRFTLTPFP